MPRRTYPRRQSRPRWQPGERTNPGPEDMARDLVRRGLASPRILMGDPPRTPRLPHHTQEEEAA